MPDIKLCGNIQKEILKMELEATVIFRNGTVSINL